jgi:hypothetical protein
MPKEFYTERDIEDLVKRGTTSLELNDNIVLTELAFEKAQQLGLMLVTTHETPPAAPIRPYLSSAAPLGEPQAAFTPKSDDLRKRVRDAVMAKLGTQVDPTLLDAIINRVLDSLEKK